MISKLKNPFHASEVIRFVKTDFSGKLRAISGEFWCTFSKQKGYRELSEHEPKCFKIIPSLKNHEYFKFRFSNKVLIF